MNSFLMDPKGDSGASRVTGRSNFFTCICQSRPHLVTPELKAVFEIGTYVFIDSAK
jgi:hypothetical protein